MNGNWFWRLLPGLALIAFGSAVLCQQMGWWHIDAGELVSDYWPLILIYVGLRGLFRGRPAGTGTWIGSGLVLVLGLIFLNNNLNLIGPIDIGDMIRFVLPLVLIALGVRMLFGNKRRDPFGEMPPPPPPPPLPSELDAWAAMKTGAGTVPPPPSPYDNAGRVPGGTSSVGGIPAGEPVPPPNAGWGSRSGTVGGDVKEPAESMGTIKGDWHQANGPWHDSLKAMKANWRHAKRESAKSAAALKEALRDAKRAWREARRSEKYARKHEDYHFPHWHQPGVEHRSNFIGDIRIGLTYWELRPLNISHFIGDTELDLTRAHIPPGETKIHISSFIGDVKVYIPDDPELDVQVTASSFLGDIALPDRREGGLMCNVRSQTTNAGAEKRIKLVISIFIGDVNVKRIA